MKQPVIDIHVHMQPWEMMKPEAFAVFRDTQPNFAELQELVREPAKFVALMDREGIARAGIINYVSPQVIGFTAEVNEWAARYCSAFPDRLIPFGSVDPWQDEGVEAEMERLIATLRLPALKLHPPHQLVYPNQYRNGLTALETIYRKAEQANMVVMIHTGTSIFAGARNIYADPIYVDDVAVDFPRLRLILAHGGRPLWMETAVFLIRRHPNVYMDISSIPPQNLLKYFPSLEALAEKVLWGSDWPGPMVPGMRTNLERFCQLPLSEGAKQRILYENALRLFPV
ncbi:MAG: amidohydrolase family protein [Terriglobia bacterium]